MVYSAPSHNLHMRHVRLVVVGCSLLIGLGWIVALLILINNGPKRIHLRPTAITRALATSPIQRDFREAFSLAEMFHFGTNRQTVDLDRARRLYKEAHTKAPSAAVRGWCNLGLGDTWLQERQLGHAITEYIEAVKEGHDDGVLRIGDLYTRGAHPFVPPDKVQAARLYKEFERAPSTLGKWCASRSNDIGSIRYDADAVMNGRETTFLPRDIVGQVHAALLERTRAGNPTIECAEGAPPPPIDVSAPPLPIQREIPRPRVRNDMQNVHDPALQNAGIKTLAMCDKSAPSTTSAPYALKDFARSMSKDGRRVFDSLTDVINERYGRSEKSVLQTVWHRIHHPDNKDKRAQLLLALRTNLESCVEHDHVVCSSGKIARILSTLEVLDVAATPLRPEWAIKEEISRMIGRVLMDALERSSEEVRDAYNEATPDSSQTDMADRLRERVRDEVRRRCEREYADVMDANKLGLYLDPLLEHV